MTLLTLSLRNLGRNRFRWAMTLLGCAVAILAFIALRTVLSAWVVAVDFAAKDRIGTRHEVSFGLHLPKHYIDVVRETPGVSAATWVTWFGGKNPRNASDIFVSLACDPASMLAVYDEIDVAPEQRRAWLEDRRGALIGDQLARKLGVVPGDRITLSGTIYPGDWVFNVSGVYTATRRTTLDRQQFLFHWDYLDASLPEDRRDRIGWIISRIDDPEHAAAVSRSIDTQLGERETPTLTLSERQMNLSIMGMISALLAALDAVSVIILAIMMLILGNTIAMGVRERTREYALLRALGFMPRQLGLFVLLESCITGALGGALGLLLAYPIVQEGLGRWIEENLGRFFPYFRIDPSTAGLAVGLGALLGVAAAIVPAIGAMRLHVITALRRVG